MNCVRVKRRWLYFGIAALALAATGLARAGDDSFATDDHMTDEKGTIYYGFVHDDHGRLIIGASVTLRSKGGLSVKLTTNYAGLYRGQIAKDVEPRDVGIICEKEGYEAGAAVLKSQTPLNGRIEAPCLLKRLPG